MHKSTPDQLERYVNCFSSVTVRAFALQPLNLFQKLIDKSHAALNLLNSFENDVNRTCTSVANINNRFKALSDTQFIENKVRDESPETEKCDTVPVQVRFYV